MNFVRCLVLVSLAFGAVFLPSRGGQPKPGASGPLAPEEARKQFRLAKGLRIELVAAEPNIESPVAMAFDEQGKLWVVEMLDYPNGPGPGQPPAGRIRILEDKDGDGVYETSHIFADKLLYANGLMPWKDGVLVTAAPHIVWLRDTDGDGKADKQEVLYEGFAAQNPQLRVSHPNLGIDGWVYVANGLRGGAVVSAKAAGTPISLAGMDFRFDLLHDRGEAVSGMGQFGNTFDDWGRRFVCDNRHHLRHIVFDNRYLKRNPYLAAPALVEDISILGDGPLSSGGKIFPLSKNWTTSNLHEGRFTAACGVFVYRGTLLKELRGSAFTCDPTGNLVHQEILAPKGATFESRPAQDGVEFLATPDDWCRPVFLTSGPDGALYMVDMYRAVIEHPDFMPPELKKRPDLNLGKDRGRIWRIVPEKYKHKALRPNLAQASAAELVALLEHPEAWWRTTAQRLIMQRQDKESLRLLQLLVLQPNHQPVGRLHAAWLLHHLADLNDDLLLALLQDQHPRLREHAVLLAEKRLAASRPLQERVLALAQDSDARVRYQVALSLGEWDNAGIVPALAAIALKGADDRWTRLAVASAVPQRSAALLVQVLHDTGLAAKIDPARLALVQELAALSVRAEPLVNGAQILQALKAYSGKEARAVHVAGFKGAIAAQPRLLHNLKALAAKGTKELLPLAAWFDAFLHETARSAGDVKAPLPERIDSIALMTSAAWPDAKVVLVPMLTDDPAQEVRLAAVRSLAAFTLDEVPAVLMKAWRSYTPAVRREVTEAMLRSPDRIKFLLGEIEAKRVKPGDLDTLRTRQLVNHANPEIRSRARKLLQENLPADRKLVLTRYQAALGLKGDPLKGRAVFKKNCATCHKIAGIGIDVGPDISDTRTKTPEGLLVDILNPNQAIDNNFVNYLVTTKTGKSLTGILVAETASSITLKRAEGQSDVVLRQDIEEIQSSGVSLMPEAMEKSITVPEMADLLSFLKNWRYLDGAVPMAK